jgi:type I restriction enzyme S subunit
MIWRRSVLGDHLDILSGFAFKSEWFNTNGRGLPLVRIRDVVPGESDTYYSGPYQERYVITNGDVLIGMDGEFNRARWRGGRALLNQRVCKVSPSNGTLDQRYLFHVLPQILKKIEDKTPFVTVKHLSVNDLREAELLLPPISEQRRIAAILDKVDDVRRKREKSLAMANEVVKSGFLTLFGDPSINPKGWPIRRMDQLGDVQGGLQVSKKRDSLSLKKPYLRVANVYRDELDIDEIKEIGLTQDEYERVQLLDGDVLIVEGHGNPEEIGRAAVWDASIDDCVHQNHLIRFRSDKSIVLPDYISRFLNSQSGRRQLIAAGRTTSGLNTISTRKVKEVLLPVPPIELQRTFRLFIQRHKTLRSLMRQHEQDALALFGSFAQHAVRANL